LCWGLSCGSRSSPDIRQSLTSGRAASAAVKVAEQEAIRWARRQGEARFGGATAIAPVGGWDPALIKDLCGDVDGDSRIDLVRVYENGPRPAGNNAYAQVNKSVGSGFGPANSNAEMGGWAGDTKDELVDVTGDGRADLVRTWHCGTNTCIQVRPRTGRASRPSRSTPPSARGTRCSRTPSATWTATTKPTSSGSERTARGRTSR